MRSIIIWSLAWAINTAHASCWLQPSAGREYCTVTYTAPTAAMSVDFNADRFEWLTNRATPLPFMPELQCMHQYQHLMRSIRPFLLHVDRPVDRSGRLTVKPRAPAMPLDQNQLSTTLVQLSLAVQNAANYVHTGRLQQASRYTSLPVRQAGCIAIYFVTLVYFVLFHFISFHFISFHFISFYSILFLWQPNTFEILIYIYLKRYVPINMFYR